MGSRLSSLLVQEGIITLEALKEALALQVIRSGQLDTILLEKKLCDEPTLLGLLGRATGYPPLEPRAMEALDPACAALVPLDRAERLGICPVTATDEDVVLLVSASSDPVHLEELAFELGRRLSPLVATEVRLLQAWRVVYGTELAPRYQRLLKRLGAVPPPAHLQVAEGVASLPVLTPHIQPRRRPPIDAGSPAAVARPFQALIDTALESEDDGYQLLQPLPPEAEQPPRPAEDLPEEPPALPTNITDEFPPVATASGSASAVAATGEAGAEAGAGTVPDATSAAAGAAPWEQPTDRIPPPSLEAMPEAGGAGAEREGQPAAPAEQEVVAELVAEPPPGMPPVPADATFDATPPGPVLGATPAGMPPIPPDAQAELPEAPVEQKVVVEDLAEAGPATDTPPIPAPSAPAEPADERSVTRPFSSILRSDSRSVTVSGELRTPTPARPRDGEAAPVKAPAAEDRTDRIALSLEPGWPAAPGAPGLAGRPLAELAPPEPPAAAPDPAAAAAQAGESEADAGPLSLEEAIAAIARAGSRDQVLLALARGMRSLLECVQVYVMRQDQLHGHLEVVGSAVDWAQIKSRRLSLELPSVVSRAVKESTLFIGPAPDTDSSPSVLISGGILALRGICLVPVTLRGKTVCLLAGHNYDQPLSQRLRAPLSRLAEEASAALASLIIRRKGGGEGEPRPGPAAALDAAERTARRDAAPARAASRARAATEQAWREAPTAEMPIRPRSHHQEGPANGHEIDAATPGHSTVPDLTAAVAAARHLEQQALAALPGLLARLEAGGADASEAEAEVVRLGTPALNLLVNQFPGWLRIDRAGVEQELPPVWECSAVLRGIMAFGRQAIPSVAPLFHHRDPQVRFFATYLMSELVYPEGVSLLATRLQDPDPGVRWIAAHVLWRFKEMDQFPEVLLDLRADLSHPDPRPRRASIEALAALGDGDSVPALVALLEDGDTGVSEAAYNALVLLTKQDFALNTGKWSTWWEANRTRPRVLWLIDGLVHGTPQVRASAARDLEELTGLTFGYRFDLPAPEREAARRRFLEWWADAGRFRFGRG